MPTNTCLYMTLASFVIGVFLAFFGNTKMEDANKLIKFNQAGFSAVQKQQTSLNEKKAELTKKQLTRREQQSKIREIVRQIDGQKALESSLKNLEEVYKASIERQNIKFDVTQQNLSAMQDQLSDDLALIERTIENIDKKLALEQERFKERQEVLAIEDDSFSREVIMKKNELKTQIESINNKITRVNQPNPNKLDQPWEVGQVMDYNSATGTILINAGSSKGIKPNFRFMVFSDATGKQRVYKGMMVVKDVSDLIATGIMEDHLKNEDAPVRGDKFGSFIFKNQKLNFYLAGAFRAKFSKSMMRDYIQYTGNNVVDELSSDVDFFIQAALADSEVPTATSLGVTIIPEELIVPFVGDF